MPQPPAITAHVGVGQRDAVFVELYLARSRRLAPYAPTDVGNTRLACDSVVSVYNDRAMLLLHGSVAPAPRSFVRSRCGSGTFHATGELRASAEVAAFGAAGAPRVSLTCQQGRGEKQTRA